MSVEPEDHPQTEVLLFSCPKCGLIMSRMKEHEVDDTTFWRCWDCRHLFGAQLDRGELDLGVTP